MVALTSAIQNIGRKYPTGGRTKNTKINDVSPKRSALNRIGGNAKWTKPTLASVNPSPQIIGTESASKRSRGFSVAPFAGLFRLGTKQQS